MKKTFLAVFMSVVCLAAASIPSMAVLADGQKVVTLGADLTEDQRQAILRYFGVAGQSLTTLTITNQDERDHLGAYVPLEQIGTHTYSCALVNPTTSGGIQVKTANLSWVTSNMIATTLSTSGVVNCDVLAAAPFEVSGTGALTGILMAYESAAGIQLDSQKKEVATQELITTTTLAGSIGQAEATDLVNESKMQVIQDNVIERNDIDVVVNEVSAQENIYLSDEDHALLVDLMEKIAEQDYNYEDMKTTLERVEDNMDTLLNQTPETQAPETQALETPAPDAAVNTGGTAATDVPQQTETETETPETLSPDSILNMTDDSALGDANFDATDDTVLPEQTEAPAQSETAGDIIITSTDSYTDTPDNTAPETAAPETTAPETAAPETIAPETTAPETTASETAAPETTTPETMAPETTAPETTTPETAASETEPVIEVYPESQPATEAAPALETAGGEVMQGQPADSGEPAAPEDMVNPETPAPETANPEETSGSEGTPAEMQEMTEAAPTEAAPAETTPEQIEPAVIAASDMAFAPSTTGSNAVPVSDAGLNELTISFQRSDIMTGTGTLTVSGPTSETISMQQDAAKVSIVPLEAEELAVLGWTEGCKAVIHLSTPLAQSSDYSVTLSDDAFMTADGAIHSAAVSDPAAWTIHTSEYGFSVDKTNLTAGSTVTGQIMMDGTAATYACIEGADPAMVSFDMGEFSASGSFNATLNASGKTSFNVSFYDVAGGNLLYTIPYTLDIK